MLNTIIAVLQLSLFPLIVDACILWLITASFKIKGGFLPALKTSAIATGIKAIILAIIAISMLLFATELKNVPFAGAAIVAFLLPLLLLIIPLNIAMYTFLVMKIYQQGLKQSLIMAIILQVAGFAVNLILEAVLLFGFIGKI